MRRFSEVLQGSRKDLLAGLAIVACAFLIYANTLGNGFVWDDEVVIVRNPVLRGSALSLFIGIDAGRDTELTPYYRPLTLLTFLMEERLHGLNPSFMHLFNVVLHAANAFLVYHLGRTLAGGAPAGILAGLLFAFHPLHSEGVAFLSGGRNTMLACLFALAAYLVHRRSRIQENSSILMATAGGVLFLAGIFSKETAFGVFPFIVAMEMAPSGTGTTPMRSRLMVFERLIPYGAGIVIYLLLRTNALTGAGVSMEVSPGLSARLLDNLYIIPRCLLSVVWPVSLSAHYFIPDDLHLFALPLAVSWLCIFAAVGWLFFRGRSRASCFGLLWAVAFWLPVSGIFKLPSAQLADRYLYISAIGLWLIIADQAMRLLPPGTAARRRSAGVVLVILLVLSVLTLRRNLDWSSNVALFTRVVEQYPEEAFGYHNRGTAYLDRGKNLDKAEKEFEKAYSLDPAFPRLRTQMGYIRLLREDYEGALRHYDAALRINPHDAEALLNRGIVLERLGRLPDALHDFKMFLAVSSYELAESRPYALARVRELSGAFAGK